MVYSYIISVVSKPNARFSITKTQTKSKNGYISLDQRT